MVDHFWDVGLLDSKMIAFSELMLQEILAYPLNFSKDPIDQEIFL
jgi:hypothetical protein